MANYAEYFAKNRYQPKYLIGDRVRGVWNKIPFSGTVCIDSKIGEEQEACVIVQSDLPIKYKDVFANIIQVNHTDLDYLK
jgi:hypothetical protein